MKAIQVSEFGEPDVLKYVDVDEPVPGAMEVRVKLYAVGVNPSDAYTRTGTYAFNVPSLPYIPGCDGAGVIEAVGAGVDGLQVGDRVFVAAAKAKTNTGTYAQKVVCDASAVHNLPDTVTFIQGAALGVPAITAYRALVQRAKVKSGETVLIHGASGGVGLLAVQIAVNMGLTVIGTASTSEGKTLVKESGAHHVFSHITLDTLDQVLSVTQGKGADVIIEFLANVNLETDLKMLAQYGRVVVVGNRGSLEFNPRLLMMKEADVLGMALWNTLPDAYLECLGAIESLLRAGILHPEVGDEFKLEDATTAHKQILTKQARGKMVLSIA